MPEEMPERFTFAHFVDEAILAERVESLTGTGYTAEHIASTAFYFGVLNLNGIQKMIPLYGDIHNWMHVMATAYCSPWLTDFIVAGCVDPRRVYEFVVREHGDLLVFKSGDEESEPVNMESEDIMPMDETTFKSIWGGFEQ